MAFDKIICEKEFTLYSNQYQQAVLKGAYLERFLSYVSHIERLKVAIEKRYALYSSSIQLFPSQQKNLKDYFYIQKNKIIYVNNDKQESTVPFSQEEVNQFKQAYEKENERIKSAVYPVQLDSNKKLPEEGYKNCYIYSINKLNTKHNGILYYDQQGNFEIVKKADGLNQAFKNKFKKINHRQAVSFSHQEIIKNFEHNPTGNRSQAFTELLYSNLIHQLLDDKKIKKSVKNSELKNYFENDFLNLHQEDLKNRANNFFGSDEQQSDMDTRLHIGEKIFLDAVNFIIIEEIDRLYHHSQMVFGQSYVKEIFQPVMKKELEEWFKIFLQENNLLCSINDNKLNFNEFLKIDIESRRSTQKTMIDKFEKEDMYEVVQDVDENRKNKIIEQDSFVNEETRKTQDNVQQKHQKQEDITQDPLPIFVQKQEIPEEIPEEKQVVPIEKIQSNPRQDIETDYKKLHPFKYFLSRPAVRGVLGTLLGWGIIAAVLTAIFLPPLFILIGAGVALFSAITLIPAVKYRMDINGLVKEQEPQDIDIQFSKSMTHLHDIPSVKQLPTAHDQRNVYQIHQKSNENSSQKDEKKVDNTLNWKRH